MKMQRLLLTICIFGSSHFSFNMERISEKSNNDEAQNIARINELLQRFPVSSHAESSHSPNHDTGRYNQNNISSTRRFPIIPYQKATDIFDRDLLDNAIANCPQKLRTDLNNIAHYVAHQPNDLEVYKKLLNRVLLVGPTGSGKTTLGYAIAYHCKIPFSFVKASSLSNEFKHSFATIIDDLFEPYLRRNVPGLIIIDEISAFTKKMKNKNDADPGSVECLWMKLDEAQQQNPRLMVVLTCNKLSKIPDTIQGRFTNGIHKILLPSQERRNQVITSFFGSQVNPDLIQKIAAMTSGLSLREISLALCNAQSLAYIRCDREGTSLNINEQEISSCLQQVIDQHNELKWNTHKKSIIKNLKKSIPYIIQTATFAAGSYFAWKIYKAQTELQIKHQAENALLTRHNHQESLQQAERLHIASLQQAQNHHTQSLEQARALHNDAHSWGKTGKQIVSSAAAIVGGALATPYIKTGASWLIKIIITGSI